MMSIHADNISYVDYLTQLWKKYPYNLRILGDTDSYEQVNQWLMTLPEDSYYIGNFIVINNKYIPLLMRLKNEEDYLVFRLKFSQKVS